MRRMGVSALAGAALIVAVGAAGQAARGQSTVSASAFYNATINNHNLNQEAGEDWAWHAQFNMGHFMQAYRAWGDEAWLDCSKWWS